MPTIRIDNDVYSWLKSIAVPFEDTPNSVLRRIAKLDADNESVQKIKPHVEYEDKKGGNKMSTKLVDNPRKLRLTGKELSRIWNVEVRQSYYHKDGTFYENLVCFPGALFDFYGYIVFKTEQDYNSCPYLRIGQKLNVLDGISSIPGYKRMR
ncbi:MAG: hypothetical protein WCX07_05695 [Dehalococcoidales bacterium]|jgi:hypothetical protein